MVRLTMLNSMASTHFEASLDIQQSWGITALDLKDHIFGKTVLQLYEESAQAAAQHIQSREMNVYCLTTDIFKEGLASGEQSFRRSHFESLDHALQLASRLKAQMIRVLTPRLAERKHIPESVKYLRQYYPWVFEVFQEAADKCGMAGIGLTIENEPEEAVFSNVEEIIGFYEQVNRYEKIHFTYDVQNLWQMGTFPTLEVYTGLKPVIGYFHVKGGIIDSATKKLKWKSRLEDASWPVYEMTKQVLLDAKVPFICLNPSHGELKPGYDYKDWVKRDLIYMQNIVDEVEVSS